MEGEMLQRKVAALGRPGNYHHMHGKPAVMCGVWTPQHVANFVEPESLAEVFWWLSAGTEGRNMHLFLFGLHLYAL